ncbi:MAG: hypothetical protein ACREEM_05595 [Blastocatellia bacterium]
MFKSIPKLHSIHALPDDNAFTGRIAGKYQFTFAPKSAEVSGGKLKLKGDVTIKSPAGQKRTVSNVEATLLSTQGSIQQQPVPPRELPDTLQPTIANPAPTITDATDDLSSIGVLYLKLAPLDARALGVPMDLSGVQLNARLYPQSELERDLQWLYSAWLLASLSGNEQRSRGYLGEINRRLNG